MLLARGSHLGNNTNVLLRDAQFEQFPPLLASRSIRGAELLFKELVEQIIVNQRPLHDFVSYQILDQFIVSLRTHSSQP